MSGTVVAVFTGAAIFAGLFVVHELGHYAAGAVAGIPASARSFVVLAIPPHVALADGEEWVSPFENERFSDVYGRFDPDSRFAVLFTAGGLLAQTAVAVSVGVGLGSVAPELGRDVVGTSLWFLAGLLVVDVVATVRRGAPFGDVTHLWRLDRFAALAVLSLAFVAHTVALVSLG